MGLQRTVEDVVIVIALVDSDLLHADLIIRAVRLNKKTSGVREYPLVHVRGDVCFFAFGV